MANAYQLVPLAWLRGVLETLEQYNEQEAGPDVQHAVRLAPPHRNADPILQILDEDDAEYVHINGRTGLADGQPTAVADEFEPTLALFPQRMRNRARVLISFVQRAGATLDGHARLVYPGSGKPGSTLYELLSFAMTTPATRKHKPEPADYLDFMQLLDAVHCPRSLFARVEPSLLSYHDDQTPIAPLRIARRKPREAAPLPSTSTGGGAARWFVQE